MKADERIRRAMQANEDWVLGQIARFGAWAPYDGLSKSLHAATDRLRARGAIMYSPTLRGYVRSGPWAPPPKKRPKNT